MSTRRRMTDEQITMFLEELKNSKQWLEAHEDDYKEALELVDDYETHMQVVPALYRMLEDPYVITHTQEEVEQLLGDDDD